MAKFATLWFIDSGPLNDTWRKVSSYTSDKYPKPSVIRDIEPPSDEAPYTATSLIDGHLSLYITHEHLPDAPHMWYVYLTQPHPVTPSQSLIAFDTDHYPEGTVISVDEARGTNVLPADRIAAINWGLHDPVLYQLYVAKSHRRRRIGTKIINACDILQVARGTDKFIYGGEQVTELGKQYGEAWIGSARRRDPKIMMPPMD